MARAPVLVVGAGVSGLTCAVRLLEAGLGVELWAREPPERTTSAIAAAIWYPYRAYPQDRVGPWAQVSHAEFLALAADGERGVILGSGIEVFREPAPDPWWRAMLPNFRRARRDELPAGCVDGWVSGDLPIIEMPVYLAWLRARLQELGGSIAVREVGSLEEASEGRRVVVNCTGLGARDLLRDAEMFPIRGQVVRVAQVGLTRYVLDERNPAGLAYIIPRSRDVILGGTVQEGNWSLEVDAPTARSILERCIALEPRLAGSGVVGHGVGLRPGRPVVRLEAERLGDAVVVHDYGHGGSGVTLSWGCAGEVARLALEALG